jgi:hypothetical protein
MPPEVRCPSHRLGAPGVRCTRGLVPFPKVRCPSHRLGAPQELCDKQHRLGKGWLGQGWLGQGTNVNKYVMSTFLF